MAHAGIEPGSLAQESDTLTMSRHRPVIHVVYSLLTACYLTRARSEPASDPVKPVIGKWVDLSTLPQRMYWVHSIANSGFL